MSRDEFLMWDEGDMVMFVDDEPWFVGADDAISVDTPDVIGSCALILRIIALPSLHTKRRYRLRILVGDRVYYNTGDAAAFNDMFTLINPRPI